MSSDIPSTDAPIDGDTVSDASPSPDARLDRRAVISLVFDVGAAFDRFTGQMRRSFGINAHERLALSLLWERDSLTMSELGQWIPLSRAAVTTLVDRMEAAGLVERADDPHDRRRTVVRRTAVADARMTPVIMPWMEDVHALAERNAHVLDDLVRLMTDFREITGAHADRLGALADHEIHQLARPEA